MNNKLILIILVVGFLSSILFLVPSVSAQVNEQDITDIFRQDSVVDFKFSCTDDTTNLPCDSTYACNITVLYPNSTLLINNNETTRGETKYNISLPDTSVLGFYKYEPFCTNGTSSGTGDNLYYQITPTGFVLSTSQGIVYFLILVLSLGLFGISLWGAIILPWSHVVDDGRIIGVNMLKYGKLSLWFVSYIFLVWMAWLVFNISFGFLNFDVASNFFEVIFRILLALTFPAFTIFFVALIVNFLNDLKIKAALERGLDVRF